MTFNRQITFLLGIVCLLGCGMSDSEYVAVTGTVVYQGETVAGATVAFRGAGSAKPALGITSDSGEFSLATGASPGAKPGEHVVTVTKYVVQGEPPAADLSMEEAGRQQLATTSRTAIPPQYASPASTDLRYTVKTDSANQFTIELTD